MIDSSLVSRISYCVLREGISPDISRDFSVFIKLRGFSRIDLPCIDICYNALPIQYLWFFKARGHTSGAPGSRKKACSSGLNELNNLVCVSVFRAIRGIFDQGPFCEIRCKSFFSPASTIAEQNDDCHKRLNGRMLQPDSQTNPEEK